MCDCTLHFCSIAWLKETRRHFSPFVQLSFLLHLLSLKKHFFLLCKRFNSKQPERCCRIITGSESTEQDQVVFSSCHSESTFSSVPSGDAIGSVCASYRLASMTSLWSTLRAYRTSTKKTTRFPWMKLLWSFTKVARPQREPWSSLWCCWRTRYLLLQITSFSSWWTCWQWGSGPSWTLTLVQVLPRFLSLQVHTTTDDADGLDDVENSLLYYNQAIIHYYLRQFSEAISIGERLYQFLEPFGRLGKYNFTCILTCSQHAGIVVLALLP